MGDKKFDANLNSKEKAPWDKFCLIVKNFLGKYKSPNYVQMVNNFLQAYQELGARMSLKIHFFHSHLDFTPQTWEILVMNMVNDFTKK